MLASYPFGSPAATPLTDAGATMKIKMRAVNEADPGPFGDETVVVVN